MATGKYGQAMPAVSVGDSSTKWGGKNAGGKAKAPTGKSGYLEVDRNMKGKK